MDPEQAKRLGQYLRQAREAKALSGRQLAEETDINHAHISRIEAGLISTPAPDKLVRLAEVLDLEVADVFALAEYASPSELPSFTPYLRTKYRDLPEEAVERIEKYVNRLAKQHGVDLAGPAPGEDEKP